MTQAKPPSKRTRVVREPHRGVYERDACYAILDEALVCHVGFEVERQPYVIPTMFARVGDRIYFHGSAASRMLRHFGEGAPACITVTLLDGIVLARSVFNHSMNYRSVVALGTPRAVTDAGEKRAALEAFTDKVLPGRWGDARPPTESELAATSILAMPLDEMSAKTRQGPPEDAPEDESRPVWAGVIPLGLVAGAPIIDPKCPQDIAVPGYLQRRLARHNLLNPGS